MADKPIKETSPGGLAKYTPSVLSVIGDSMDKRTGLDFTVGSGSNAKTVRHTIKKSGSNQKTLQEYVRLAASVGTDRQALKLELETTDGSVVLIGSLAKKYVKASKFNRGDVSEGILAAAITARFVNKNKPITHSDVIDILRKLKPTGTKVNQTFDSLNSNPAVLDEVRVVISLAKNNMDALLNEQNYAGLKDLIASSAAYANGRDISSWSKLLYENNVRNEIEVTSDGLLDQRGTKVDLRVKVDGKLTNVNVSLKAGDVKQFGQVSGSKLENMASLFNPLGVKVEAEKSKFNEFLNKGDTVKATSHIYNYVADWLIAKSSNNKKEFIKNLSDFIVFHATRNEDHVTLVQLNRSQAKVYTFTNLEKVLQSIEPTIFIKNGYSDVAKAQVPTIVIADKSRTGKSELLTIRMKIDTRADGFYHRNYIEKGALLGDLIAEYA